MALFSGNLLYPRNIDQDQTWGTNVKQLSGTSAADTSFAITYTSTTATTHTIKPYVSENASSTDNRTNYGWALNESASSTDGMGSTLTMHRYIQAGTWTLATNISYTAPALLASYDITAEYSVYRVAIGGGTRTLLFTTTSNTIAVSLAAGSGTLTANSSQPVIEFQSGETFHVAIRITAAATSATLGGTTNSVITVETGSAGGITVTLPSLGLKSLYLEDALSSSVLNSLSNKILNSYIGAVTIVNGNFNKSVKWYREFTSITTVNSSVNKLLVLNTVIGANTILASVNKLLIKDDITSNISIETNKNTLFIKPTYNSSVITDSNYQKQVIYNRSIDADISAVSDFTKQVIYVRDVDAIIGFNLKSRICLDIDDLPDAGTPVVINKQRFMEWE